MGISNAVALSDYRISIDRESPQLLYLPPYSPDLNSIEKMWSKMKVILRRLMISIINRQFSPICATIFLKKYWSGIILNSIFNGNTDLQRGIDGLVGMAQMRFQLGPFQNALFLLCGQRKDRIKGLYWEGVLLYKCLESGNFQWPRNCEEARQLVPVTNGGAERGVANVVQTGVRAEFHYGI